jgi:CheY-like chemotaxis protein
MSRAGLVWVVEDNDQNFELIDFLLEEAGHRVARARDGGELVRLLDGEAPDLILLDMNLPTGSGLDLLAELRGRERFRPVPVVAVTAHAMHGDRERFLAAGCDGYVSKPIDSALLLAEVARRVGGGER